MIIPEKIIFSNSYVLSLKIEPNLLVLGMDFVLAPEHSSYQPPKPGDWACFQRGTLSIDGFSRIVWDVADIKPSVDADGEQDWGCLDSFKYDDGCWYLEGDWGIIEVTSGNLKIDFLGK